MNKKMTGGRKWANRKSMADASTKLPGRIALMPASQLPSADKWAEKAKALESGATLVVLPANNARLQAASHRLKVIMSKHGRPVIIQTVH